MIGPQVKSACAKRRQWSKDMCSVALGYGVAQSVARWFAVRQARVRISDRHHKGGGPLPSGSNEEIKSGARRVVYIKHIICMLD